MEIGELISLLQGVKGRDGSWAAKCPAHEDRTPSLAVKHLADGRILLHCFGGCETEAILRALGICMGDLFPDGPVAHWSPRAAFTAMEALRCIGFEAGYLALAAADLAAGKPVDAERLAEASSVVLEAVRLTDGH